MNVKKIIDQSIHNNKIEDSLYKEYDVKKGLRNEDGTGVVVGLTKICDVVGYYRDEEGRKVDCPGKLIYRGISLKEIQQCIHQGSINGYEDICFLLITGHLPNHEEAQAFRRDLRDNYHLPGSFLSENILGAPSMDIMNKIQRSILMLYSFDTDNPDDASPTATIQKGLSLIAKAPAIIVYSYFSKALNTYGEDLIIHPIREDLDLAESFLYLLKGDQYTQKEVDLLNFIMIVHAEHGLGNNSTFTNLVVSSTGTDVYSSFAASVGSLKGPKHGGANILARNMMKEVMAEIGTQASDEQIIEAIKALLAGQLFDGEGLVYGIGHAIYTLSDPRCQLLKEEAQDLAQEKGRMEEYSFYNRFEKLACQYLTEKTGKNRCANVDFYSGFIYDMMGIPQDLYTPIFVLARLIGWLSHNVEEKVNSGKIIRPAGRYIGGSND